MAARSKAPTIGSAGWILEERHQSNTLVAQELEDFGFSVRNELEWLNEHMFDILSSDRQPSLDVFKTPGKLRGKTPRTARKKAADRQPLASIHSANLQIMSPAEQSLRNVKARFQIAEDAQHSVRQSPITRTPIARQLFPKPDSAGKENVNSGYHADIFEKRQAQPVTTLRSPIQSTQDTAISSQGSDVFSPPQSQETQPTQPTQSFRHSIDDKPDAGDSFVSANEGFASKNDSKEDMDAVDASAMELDGEDARSDAQDTMLHHDISDAEEEDASMHDMSEFPDPPRVVSEQYSISAETHEALDTANERALAPEPKNLALEQSTTPAGLPPAHFETEVHDDTVLHHQIDDQMAIDDDERSPSDNSSPVKPLVRKSSLNFASLPAREPLLPKKSMGNRVSRTSYFDQNNARNSQMARFTGGKSLGGSQIAYPAEMHHEEDDDMDVDNERPELAKDESESTKAHSKTSTQRLFERINMLKQQNEAPKRISQNVISSRLSQQQNFSTQPTEEVGPAHHSQPTYPTLPPPEPTQEEDDDDDWISPVRATAPLPKSARPGVGKSHTAEARPSPPKHVPASLVSVTNPELFADIESTTPLGSPLNRRIMDAPLSASKSKLYSAFRAAKDKLIGSTAASAQVKMDSLKESPARPKLPSQDSSDDASSPKRTERPISIFGHMRSPSKDSDNSSKGSAMPSSPFKADRQRTDSSEEREKQKDKETREKEVREAKQQQRNEDKLRQMREKEQSKAAAHAQKARAMGVKTPTAMSSQSSLRMPAATANTKTPVQASQPAQPAPQQSLFRPGIPRSNTVTSKDDVDSSEDMPPPPAPKSLLPTTKAPLREPKKLPKPTSKDTLPKAKAPQKIMVNLKSSHYGQAPPPAARPGPASGKPLHSASASVGKATAPVSRPTQAARPASALSTTTKSSSSKTVQPLAKAPAPRTARPQPQTAEKPKASAPQPTRADLGAARPVSRMQTVQDANRINIPPVNPAKPPPKRQFPGEGEETLHRPAKRPSQQARNLNPITPAHSQFAKGKIPFAEPPQSQSQYPNGDDIKLPEIMTDSEDEDSDNEFEQPSWVNTPNLREMLSNQQLMDPEHIFGPIPPLEMEKVFPNKERHKRFRQRTSSAYWANDEVTSEEKRKEREARERLVRDGGWTYNPSPLPKQSSSSRS